MSLSEKFMNRRNFHEKDETMKYIKKIMILTSVAILCLSFSVKAETKTVTLAAVADTDVRNYTSADYAKGNRTWHYLCNHPSATGISGKVYIRFEMPHDIGNVTSATLKLVTGAVCTGSTSVQINVSGLNDGIAYEDTWKDLSPGTYYSVPTGGLTWNNAPGNLKSSTYLFDANQTVLLGNFTMLGQTTGAVIGDLNILSTQALADYLNTDTNHMVSFLIGKVGVESTWHGIAANELGTQPGPKLEITYNVAVPVRYLNADVNKDLRVDLKDFAELAESWMQCSTPNDVNCQ
jgi:hypothetical protein